MDLLSAVVIGAITGAVVGGAVSLIYVGIVTLLTRR